MGKGEGEIEKERARNEDREREESEREKKKQPGTGCWPHTGSCLAGEREEVEEEVVRAQTRRVKRAKKRYTLDRRLLRLAEASF